MKNVSETECYFFQGWARQFAVVDFTEVRHHALQPCDLDNYWARSVSLEQFYYKLVQNLQSPRRYRRCRYRQALLPYSHPFARPPRGWRQPGFYAPRSHYIYWVFTLTTMPKVLTHTPDEPCFMVYYGCRERSGDGMCDRARTLHWPQVHRPEPRL